MDVDLRPLTVADADALRPLLTDPDVRIWNPLSSADPAIWIESVVGEDDRSATFAVVGSPDGPLIGTVSLFSIDPVQGTAELGYRVLPAARGHGVATAAVRALATYGFTDRGLRRIQLFHAIANPASCRVAARAGFRVEGTLRASYVYGDGVAHDEHLHARLAGERSL